MKLSLAFLGSAMAIVTLLVGGLLLFVLFRAGASRRDALLAGERASATILSATDTGTRVNGKPKVRLELEVHPDAGRPPFRVTFIATVPRDDMARFQPGMMLPVRFDPNRPTSVALEL